MSDTHEQLEDRLRHLVQSFKKEWILSELLLMQEAKRRQPSLDQIAEAHWDYVASVLRAHGEVEDVIKKCGHHYRTAFVHGWKHAEEECKNSEF